MRIRLAALSGVLAVAAALLVAPTAAGAVEQSPAVAAARDAGYDAYQSVLKPALAVPIGWTGSTSPCDPGAPSAAAQEATLQALNYARRLAGLAAVSFDPVLSARGQKAALIMQAQGELSHNPPPNWACWTQEGRDGAATSNLYLGVTGAEAMIGYLADPGSSNYFVGHRRWMLYPPTRIMGSGSTSNANALVVFGAPTEPDTGPGFLSWPTPGAFPVQLEPAGRWSLSAPDRSTDFSGASVTVTRAGAALPVRRELLNDAGFGNRTLVFQVDTGGARAGEPDTDYAVTVSGIRRGNGDVVSHSWTTSLFDAEVDARQSVSLGALPDARYGDLQRVVASASSGLPVALSSRTPNTCVVEGSSVRMTGVGTCTVAADQAGDAVRRPAASVTRSLAVAQRPAVVRADDVKRHVGQPNPALTVTYDGLLEPLASSDVRGAPSCSTTAAADSVPGRYPVTCSLGTLTSERYTLSTAPATLTVTEPPPVVTLTPSTISAGQRTTVTYRGAPGSTIEVLARTQPATSYVRVATVRLDDAGVGTSTHAPQKSTRITARSAGGTLSDQQPVVGVRSVASLTVTRVAGRTYAFSGRVYPAREGRLVNVYREGVLAAQGRTDASGVYRISKLLPAGVRTYVVRTPDDTHNLGTTSPARRFAVS